MSDAREQSPKGAQDWSQSELGRDGVTGELIGLERTILPAIAEQEFQLPARAAVLSFIVVFGGSRLLQTTLPAPG